MSLRVMPRIDGPVLVDYLGVSVRGTVVQIAPGGQALEVLTEDGETLAFTLNPATARFTAGGGQAAPRLRFAGE